MKKRTTVKVKNIVFFIVALLLCGAIFKLLFVATTSTADGVNLKVFASNRNEKKKTLYADRGTIYDRNGETLASSVNSYTLIAYLSKSRTKDMNNPKHVVDKVETAKKLATVLDIEEEQILKYLSKEAYQVEFGSKAKRLTEIQKKAIEELELPGIDFIESTQRYYKMGDFASYIIGYAKMHDNGQIVGELGLEKYFNEELSGTDGYEKYESDAYGYALPNGNVVVENATDGENIYLTLDNNIQLIVENAVADITNNYKMDYMTVSVVDAHTGAIVASGSYPSFNPNDLNTLTSYINPLVSYTFEPGSVMKIFSWLAAMENDIYEGDKTFKSGSIEVADVKISDHNKAGWGTITYDKGFAYSSNVGATNLALTLGVDKLLYFYQRMGFGSPTGIELSGEEKGKISFKYKSELATAAFGQGITVTPIQMIQALTALTNDGVMLKPYLVDRIVNNNQEVIYEGKRTEIDNAVSKESISKMQSLLYDVVYNGLSKIWQPKNVKLVGKTGTAQISSPKGGYLTGKYDYVYSFGGYFPYENPKYIIYAAVKKLNGPQSAVGKLVTTIADEISSYDNLTSLDNQNSKDTYLLPNYVSKKLDDIKETLSKNIDYIIIGDGSHIISQFPSKDTIISKDAKVYLLTNYEKLIMPDMTGWSLSEVKNYAYLINRNVNIDGYGYVKTQSIKPNEEIPDEGFNVTLSK